MFIRSLNLRIINTPDLKYYDKILDQSSCLSLLTAER